jgi:hypothetical protein
VVFHKVDLGVLLVALSIQLEHLDQTVRGLLHDIYLEIQTQKLDTDVEVVEKAVYCPLDLSLLTLDRGVKVCQKEMDDI